VPSTPDNTNAQTLYYFIGSEDLQGSTVRAPTLEVSSRAADDQCGAFQDVISPSLAPCQLTILQPMLIFNGRIGRRMMIILMIYHGMTMLTRAMTSAALSELSPEGSRPLCLVSVDDPAAGADLQRQGRERDGRPRGMVDRLVELLPAGADLVLRAPRQLWWVVVVMMMMMMMIIIIMLSRDVSPSSSGGLVHRLVELLPAGAGLVLRAPRQLWSVVVLVMLLLLLLLLLLLMIPSVVNLNILSSAWLS
jgi:uncharacterized membrane protein YhaH (DUF805 family)